MINIILTSFSCAFFAWFFAYAIENVPFLKWYHRFITSLPDRLTELCHALGFHKAKPEWFTGIDDPLGNCPFCFAPWFYVLFILFTDTRPFILTQFIFETAFAFGWIYATNIIFSRYIDTD